MADCGHAWFPEIVYEECLCIHVSYSAVVLYVGIMQVWDFLPQYITSKPA